MSSRGKVRRTSRGRGSGGRGARYQTGEGMLVLLEESHDLPMVDIQVALRTGSVHDPEGREGLARLTGRMIRMGTASMDGNDVEETIARLGGRLTVETAPSFMRFHGTVIKRNLEPFVELLSSLIRQPAFRTPDIAHVKRETISDIIAGRDNDRGIAARRFRAHLFGDHPYGRSVIGTRASVRAIRRADVVRHYREHFVAKNMLLGAAGDLTRHELDALVERHFKDLPGLVAPTRRVPAPKLRRGRRVLIVDKPARSQTQLFVGGLGSRAYDDDLYPLLVANTAFGGTFTARLMNEVRSKRGWSYGAYSRLGQDRQRDAWYMWTFPAAKDVAACLALELEMLGSFVADGITGRELSFAKKYLMNSHCFEVDTAAKRLDARVDCELYDLAPDRWRKFVPEVRAVKHTDANAAVRRRLSSRNVTVVLVATAKDVRREVERVPGLTEVKTVPYDRD